VYQLDDNTLTIAKVNKEIADLQEIITDNNLTISAEQFEKKLITSFK
jgi:hypothetical protein